MKKTLLLILTILILTLSLTTPVLAAPPQPTLSFSEDFITMYYDGYSFSRINDTRLYGMGIYDSNYLYSDTYTDSVTGETYPYKVELSDSQEKLVKDVEVFYVSDEILFEIVIYYKDGATLDVTFMRDDYITQYNAMLKDNDDYVQGIDFYWYYEYSENPELLEFTKNELQLGEEKKIRTVNVNDYFDIFAYNNDNKLMVTAGVLICCNDGYYYLDLTSDEYINIQEFFVYDFDVITARKINNEEICAKFDTGIDAYYSDDFNYIYNDELLDGASKVLLTAIFLLLPLIVFIIFLVLFIREKKPIYKKIYILTCVLSIVEVILFFITQNYIFK